MTKRSRRPHSAAFKARVALVSLKEDATMAELAARFGVPPSRIQVWRKQLVESAGTGAEGIARENRSTDDGAGFSGGSVEASTGSVVEATVFGESSIDGGIATGWGNHQPQAGSTADAEVAGGVSQAADDAPGTDSRALPLVAAGGSGDASESGVGGGSDLHSDGAVRRQKI